jgi:hypothetical protein
MIIYFNNVAAFLSVVNELAEHLQTLYISLGYFTEIIKKVAAI